MHKHAHLMIGQGLDFDYVVNLSQPPADAGYSSYAGFSLRCDIKLNGVLVHDFGILPIVIAPTGAGMANLSAPTTSWPLHEILEADFLLVDPTNKPVGRSEKCRITMVAGVTN